MVPRTLGEALTCKMTDEEFNETEAAMTGRTTHPSPPVVDDGMIDRLSELHQKMCNALSGPMGCHPPPRPTMPVTLADADAVVDAMCKLDRNTRTTPSMVTDNEVETKIAEIVHDAMFWAAEQGGPPQRWQNGNSFAEGRARQAARAALSASDRDVLVNALEPFAKMAEYLDNTDARRDAIYCGGSPGLRCEVKQSDYHRARAALIPLAGEPE